MSRLLTLALALLALAVIPAAVTVAAPQVGNQAAPQVAPATVSRDTIVGIAGQMAFGQWVSPKTVTINQLVWPIRWGTFYAGQRYTGVAYTQQNPQEDWATFSANMRNNVGTPGVDQGSDCSGYTSIAWQIPRQNTWTLLDSGYAYTLGSHDELAPGDALLIPLKHVAVFFERLDSGLVVVLEQTDPKALRSEWSWAYATNYTPVRRMGVVDDYATPVAPPREAPLDGYATSSQSVTFRWRASTTSGVDGYRVLVADSPEKAVSGPWILDTSVSATTTSITRTVAARGELYWMVRACKGCSTGSPRYSTGTTPWTLSIRPPSGSWSVSYFNGTSLSTPCASETHVGSHVFKDWQTGAPAGCNADYWSARFTQSVDFAAGRYTFALGSDDWGRIKLDGTTIVDNWRGAGGRYAARDVSAGTHVVTVEYAEVTGLANLAAWWWGPGFDMPREARDPNQWFAQYYANRDLATEPVIQVNEGSGFVHHEWKTGSPGWGLPADNFSVRWERTVSLPCGLYQFRLTQNNGGRVYLDGALLPGLDHWFDADTRYTTLVRVPAGTHTIRLEYYENTGVATVGFDWSLFLACPASPSPTVGATMIPVDSALSWSLGDDTIYPVKYTVYLNRSATGGAISPTTAVCSGTSATTCDPPGDLALNSRYFWKVRADDGTGNVVDGPVWDFWTTPCPVGQFSAQYYTGQALAGSPASTACEGAPLSRDWGTGGPAGVGADSFSARYTGLFDFLDGPYTFTVTSDDGVRLWVDGVLLIDQWQQQALATTQATKALGAGRHVVKLEYFEATGGAVVRLDWQVNGCPNNQFVAHYFGNTTLAGRPLASGCEGNPLTHDWGTGRPTPGLPADRFSARWSGTFRFDGGDYTFVATADDGLRVWVDGELVIDRWVIQAPTTYRATRTLAARDYTVRVEYFENDGGALAKLDWHRGTACSINQFQVQYFPNTSLSGVAAATGCESSIANDWANGGPAGVGSDGFSARWTGTFDFATAGAYTFVATADDGVRLWVDGVLLIDKWRDQAPTTYQATRMLAAERHVVKVEYYERGGGAVAKVSWAKDCPVGQLLSQYYGNRTLTGSPIVVRCEAGINYDWGSGAPVSGLPVDNFSVRWLGTFDFTEGNHTFWARTDDGVRIYVDDVLVLDRWVDRAPALSEVTRRLTAGRHVVRVEYYEAGGGAVAQVGWNPQ